MRNTIISTAVFAACALLPTLAGAAALDVRNLLGVECAASEGGAEVVTFHTSDRGLKYVRVANYGMKAFIIFDVHHDLARRETTVRATAQGGVKFRLSTPMPPDNPSEEMPNGPCYGASSPFAGFCVGSSLFINEAPEGYHRLVCRVTSGEGAEN
ncbi:MAG: hypothetical protein HY078_07085 [Elusimicrobia bacterium]|nr:hypothetical protein [Elusimicrobiota bacterium]